MSTLSGLAQETLNYSDLVGSVEKIRASLSILEIFIQKSAPELRRQNVAISEHILRQMMDVGDVHIGNDEFPIINSFTMRVLGKPASAYILRGVYYNRDTSYKK